MEEVKRSSRRPHSAELKARVLAECARPGESVARVALAHGLNANLVHKWRRAAVPVSAPTAGATVGGAKETAGAFVALAMPSQPVPPADIRIELRRGSTTVSIHWPAQGAGACAAWLREWLR